MRGYAVCVGEDVVGGDRGGWPAFRCAVGLPVCLLIAGNVGVGRCPSHVDVEVASSLEEASEGGVGLGQVVDAGGEST